MSTFMFSMTQMRNPASGCGGSRSGINWEDQCLGVTDTPDVEAVVAAKVVRRQVGTTVFQVPAISTPRRVARPPEPTPGIVQRTAVVAAACDWAKRCFVRCRCRDLRVAWQFPTARTDRVSGFSCIIAVGINSASGCRYVVIPCTVVTIATTNDFTICVSIGVAGRCRSSIARRDIGVCTS